MRVDQTGRDQMMRQGHAPLRCELQASLFRRQQGDDASGVDRDRVVRQYRRARLHGSDQRHSSKVSIFFIGGEQKRRSYGAAARSR